MEKLDVLEWYEALIASFFTDDKGCAHCNKEHTLIYIHSGELEITENGKKTILYPGDCAFMRRDNRMWLQKEVKENEPYRSIVMKFSRNYLKNYFQNIDKSNLPANITREKNSLIKFPNDTTQIPSLFETLFSYFDKNKIPDNEFIKNILDRGMRLILDYDPNLYASLFDFVPSWKIDIADFMEKNFMNDLNTEEMAYYTGRSLASFKRDFKQISDTTPQKWIINRRLEAAYKLLKKGKKTVSEICYEVGFKNLSHFSRIFKDMYGLSPTLVI